MKKIKKYKRKLISSLVSISFSVCTFIYLLSGLITPVNAEEIYYWDGNYISYDANYNDVNGTRVYSSAQRVLYNIKPTNTIAIYFNTNRLWLLSYWYLGSYSNSTDSSNAGYQFKYNSGLKQLTQNIANGSNVVSDGQVVDVFNSIYSQYGWDDYNNAGTYYTFAYAAITCSGADFASSLNNVKYLYYLNGSNMTQSIKELILADACGFVSAPLINSNITVHGSSSSNITSYNSSMISYVKGDSDYISAEFRPLILQEFGTNSTIPITKPTDSPISPGTTPDNNGNNNDSGNGGYGAISQQQQMQQQQQIAEGAVSNTQTISPNAINNTVTVNSGSGGNGSDQTVSGLEQAASGGWFDNLESAFSGVNQMINQLKNMPKLITGLFAFLPNELLNAITIMFGIMIPIVLVKVLV